MMRCLFAALDWHLYRRYRMQVHIFQKIVGYSPEIAFPRRYHEKMLWRKIFDRNPLFVVFCDKLATKEYASQRFPEIRIPKTLWVGERVADIPPSVLARKVFIKCNHGCNFNWLWEPGVSDLAAIGQDVAKCLQETYGEWNMESAYVGVPKKVFVEEIIETQGPDGLVDINVRCADGKPILASVIIHNKSDRMKVGYFNTDCTRYFDAGEPNPQGRTEDGYEMLPTDYLPPAALGRAIAAAAKLSRGVDYARYDFMTDGENLYMGEITVYPSAGVSKATPAGEEGFDTRVGDVWDLRGSWFLSTPQKSWKRVYARLLRRAIDRAWSEEGISE